MTVWRECALGEVVNLKRGYDLPNSSRIPGPFPVVSSSGITDHHVEAKVVAPGVVTGRYGTLGQVFFIEKDFWPLNTSLYVQDFKGNDPKFISYFLRNLNLGSQNAAAAVPGVNRNHLHAMPVRSPTPPFQKRIAGILSAYDELIENSQQRIKILESMACALYREWFVYFRYPGHESVQLVPSALGEIPQGWAAVPFELLLSSMTGGDWGEEQSNSDTTEPVIVVRGTDFDGVAYGGQLRAPVRYIKPSSLTSRGLKVGDVIIENSINAKSRSVGTTLLVDEHVLKRLGRNAIAASFCKVLRPCNQEIAPLIHLHARHLREDGRMEYYQNVAANGIANFQAQRFSKEEHITFPTDEGKLVELLEPIASIFKSVAVLASKLAILRRTRDFLLPRLLSGQIDVDAAA